MKNVCQFAPNQLFFRCCVPTQVVVDVTTI